MTGYYIEVGYNSAQDKNDVWEKLKEVTKHFCDNPNLILGEALRTDREGYLKDINKDKLNDEKKTSNVVIELLAQYYYSAIYVSDKET